MKQMPNSMVRRVHFEDFGGAEFERLMFAYHVRAGWSELAWHGQTGSDQGRDIVGMKPFDVNRPATVTLAILAAKPRMPLKKGLRSETEPSPR